MKKSITFKVIETVVLSILTLEVFYFVFNFFSALYIEDYDLMFYYGITITVLFSSTFLFLYIGAMISSVWKNNKDKNTIRGEK